MSKSNACSVCGYDENPMGAEFCEACGSALERTPKDTVMQTTDNATPENGKMDDLATDQFPTQIQSGSTTGTIPKEFTDNSHFVTSTARLVLQQKQGVPVREFSLDSNRHTIIGRFDPDTGPVDVDLDGFPGDDTISRNHAEIYQEGGLWKIKDLGSTNGVFVKRTGDNRFSARITIPQLLNPGDEVAIAKICFLFQSP